MEYKTKKVLNNGVVLVQDENGKDCILIGKGIGFDSKEKMPFTQMDKVIQTFVLNEQTKIISELIKNIDARIIPSVEEEIKHIENEANKKLNENIHITLVDHIAFAIDRTKKGLDFKNPFTFDLEVIWEKEYKYARHIIKQINETFNVQLVDDEIGIVAIHIHSALNDGGIDIERKKMKLIQETIQLLCNEYGIIAKKESLSYQRLLVHIHYAYERILQNKNIDNNMFNYIMEHYGEYFRKVRQLLRKIESSYGIDIPDAEISYLVIHLVRILNDD